MKIHCPYCKRYKPYFVTNIEDPVQTGPLHIDICCADCEEPLAKLMTFHYGEYDIVKIKDLEKSEV
jgi:hypothetical protein